MNKQPFEADTGRVLNIVINSLYSDKEIFLRELISNSSDAIDKRRFERLSNKTSTDEKTDFEIKIDVSSKENTISISDDGIGMDKDDLVNSLGTIAKSGTTEFLAKLEAAKDEDKSKSLNLIGQFGVGYAAFMVSESVEVISKKDGSNKAFSWSSDGVTGFEIKDSSRDKLAQP